MSSMHEGVTDGAGLVESRLHSAIAAASLAAIALHLFLQFGVHTTRAWAQCPLELVLVGGGLPLLYELIRKLLRRDLGADLLAGISIVSAALLGEYLAGAIVVLMLSGGVALERYAVRSASSVLRALAKRMPSLAHRRHGAELTDIALEDIAVGDQLIILPHEICPVDGAVVEGHGVMDESFLTGEPFHMSKAPGSLVLSGAVNGETALTIQARKRAVDSRYAKITEVMRAAEQHRPRLRRLGDQLGALYGPLALSVACVAWVVSGEARRFLAVLVVATPCPLLIAIPVAIIGSISLCARRSLIVKQPIALEQIDQCETVIFDKTGTLTYGTPRLAEVLCVPGRAQHEVLSLTASLEQYSKHPLGRALVVAASDAGVVLQEASAISEQLGEGIRGTVGGHTVQIVSRGAVADQASTHAAQLPPTVGGLECCALIDGAYAATLRFRDEPRVEGLSFIRHLGPRHHVGRVLVVSGDRESEVRYLAERVGIATIYAEQSPEEKLDIVRRETQQAHTLFIGDGINDAPALMAASVGVAMGQHSDITSEAADVVVLDSSLTKVDELMHISRRMRAIALQSAIGGIVLSLVGVAWAAVGALPPVAGAIAQELIDLVAVLNALRAALPPRTLSDFHATS